MQMQTDLLSLTRELQESTPHNQYQLPDGFYRCDLLASIDHTLMLTSESEEESGSEEVPVPVLRPVPVPE